MGSCCGIHHVATCLTCQKGAGAMHFIVRQDRINDPHQTNLNRAELGKNGVQKGRRERGKREQCSAVEWKLALSGADGGVCVINDGRL